MDSRVVQSKVVENKDEQNLDSQQVVTHDAEEHTEPEKKSVMSRVKARARKIKNSITGHSQQTPDQTSGHDSEIQHNPEEDEDDDDVGDLDESKENVQEPLGHQAPNYGGREGKNATATTESGKVENLRNLVFDLEGSKDVGEEPYHDPLTEGVSSTTETNQNIATDKAKPFALEEKPDQFEADFEGPIVSKEDSQEQGSRTDAYDIPKYQTRDTDPNVEGSDEVKDFTPLEESLERLNVHDDDEPKPIRELKIEPSVADTEYPASAGSHDIRQPAPHFFDASKSHNEFSQETVSKGINKNHENPSETEETFNTVTNTAENQPGYEESVETQPKHNKSYADENEFASATTADKTVTREDDEAFKLSNDGTSTGSNTNDGTETDKGAAVRDYFNEKSRPGEEDKALAEVITEALHKGKDEPLKSEDGKFDSEVEKPEKVFVEESNVASPGKGVVDRVTGYVGSWFAKSEENPSPQGAGIGTEDLSKNKDSVAEGKHDGKVVGEGRIQE